MPLPQPHPPLPKPSHSVATKPKRAPNNDAYIVVAKEAWRIFEPRGRHVNDAFDDYYLLEMEIVSQKTGNHFDVTIYVDWARYYPNRTPQPGVLASLARQLVREHLQANRYPPRISNRGHIVLRWPLVEEREEPI